MEEQVIRAIQELTSEIKKENGLTENAVIRDDVFGILQGIPNCTVVYYPIESEADEDGCDGCHVVRIVKGIEKQLVFINTANARERQAFSVAHELGHIWDVDGRLRRILPEIQLDAEEVTNRFAAELLMSEKIFIEQANAKISQFRQEQGIKVLDFIRIIVYLMSYFFAPYKAVVIRLSEVKIIDEIVQTQLLKFKNSKYVESIINEEQYTRLGIKSENKSVANLEENLEEIERRELFSSNKIKAIRDTFGLTEMEEDAGLNNVLRI